MIDPPFGSAEIGGSRQNFKYALNRIPSLGLAYLAAVAEGSGHRARILDASLDGEADRLDRLVEEFHPQVVGITVTTPVFANAVRIALRLRRLLPEGVFICGGAHASACPEEAIESRAFDYVVCGEGERTFAELLNFIERPGPLNAGDIKGIVFRQADKIVSTPTRPRIEDLDSLPMPARHLLPPLGAYHPTPASFRRLPLAVVITSRGCPSRCTFCDRAVFGERFRQHSVRRVMEEVEEVVARHGAREVRFFDDTFTLNPAFVEGICRAMQGFRPYTPWTCLTKVSAVNFDMLRLMRQSGCWQVLFGLESGDDYILSRLGKENTVRQNIEAVHWAKKAGLSVRADFLVGSPWETRESLARTVALAKKLPLDFAHFNKFVPLPGTAIYQELKAKGAHISFGKGASINDQCNFVYVPPALSEAEYRRLLNLAYKDFYLRPLYILRKLLSVRTFSELVGYLKGAVSILSL